MVKQRQDLLEDVSLFPENQRILGVARLLVVPGAIPAKAGPDAVHIAAAVAEECEFFLTWNFRHIANVRIRREVEKILANHGYTKTTICTPEVPRSTDMIWTGSLRISKTVKRKVAFAGSTNAP